MKSVIICEGTTDLVFLQYFLEKVYNWQYIEQKDYKKFAAGLIQMRFGNQDDGSLKWFSHTTSNVLCMLAAGGVSKIPGLLQKILDFNKISIENQFSRIAVLSDRDEINSEQLFIAALHKIFTSFGVCFTDKIRHNEWNIANFTNIINDEGRVEFLPLVIPFEETGAMESFLLNALCENSVKKDVQQIDKQVIEQCRNFIDTIDCKGKYLKHRRDVIKAKFETAFVVMTPANAFMERGKLLRSVPWEQYEGIQRSFKKLSKLVE